MKLRVIGISTAAVYALGVVVLLGLAMLGSDGLGPLAQGSQGGVSGPHAAHVTAGSTSGKRDQGRPGASDSTATAGGDGAVDRGPSNSGTGGGAGPDGTGPGSDAKSSDAASHNRPTTSPSTTGRAPTP